MTGAFRTWRGVRLLIERGKIRSAVIVDPKPLEALREELELREPPPDRLIEWMESHLLFLLQEELVST